MGGTDFDIAVIGAGVVGRITALALEAHGYSVALIDPELEEPVLTDEFDLRSYALTPASMRLMERLYVQRAFKSERLATINAMEVWDAASSGRIRFQGSTIGSPNIGVMIEHDHLMWALIETSRSARRITSVTGRVTDIRSGPDRTEVVLDSGRSVIAGLIAGCDGANSVVRQRMNINLSQNGLEQFAVVCNVTTEREHENVARQRFLATGPLAFLPLPDPRQCAIVWTTTPSLARAAEQSRDDDFTRQLEASIEHTLGAITSTTHRRSFPLQVLHTEKYVVDRTILLGDAAHVVHPLAGQGLNLGIMDAAALADALGARDELNLRFPRSVLRRFERARRTENAVMLQLTQNLNRLFLNELEVVRKLRGAGMNAIDRLRPLKHWMILRAMGNTGDVPPSAALHSGDE